ncbi:E1-E2 ATPase-domain-containing protein [Xylariaceae sp. FL0255]|nr:E1-E2 ATPase-domain-containing protein [Xylariaceae sp. FL0255]
MAWSLTALLILYGLLESVNGSETSFDTKCCKYGDHSKVIPDTQIPTDGVVLEGTTEVKEYMLTGELRLVYKEPGSHFIAGSINGPGMITALPTKVPYENRIQTIAAVVDSAKLTIPTTQNSAGRVAIYFVPVILWILAAVFAICIGVGIRVQNRLVGQSIAEAVIYAITVMIVSCLCVIGLKVTMVVVMTSIFGLFDALRSAARTIIAALQERSISISILGGDDDGPVQAVARDRGIRIEHVRSGCSPADKYIYIQDLQPREGPQGSGKKRRKRVLVFVGHETNDTVTLTQATTGVRPSSGTNAAQASADVVPYGQVGRRGHGDVRRLPRCHHPDYIQFRLEFRVQSGGGLSGARAFSSTSGFLLRTPV